MENKRVSEFIHNLRFIYVVKHEKFVTLVHMKWLANQLVYNYWAWFFITAKLSQHTCFSDHNKAM